MNENNKIQENSVIAKLSVPYDIPEVCIKKTNEEEVVNQYFKSVSCNNSELELLLYEVIGYSLAKTSKLNKAFIFKGNGRNGKSKIFRILEALLGEEQCSHEHLENLSGCKAGSKTTVNRLNGCTVNIAEDQKQPKYINTSLITRIISGETISIEQKGKENINLVPYATMLFSVNEVIDFKETGLYITDRFIVIPFNATFIGHNRDINMGENLCKPVALQIIATTATRAFNAVLKRGEFTIPPIVEQETNKYFLECNSVKEFCDTFPINTIIIKSRYYKEYCKWCSCNNREAVSNSQFGKQVLALGYRAERYSFGNKRNTYYASPNFDNSNSSNIYNDFLHKCGMSEEMEKTTDEKILKDHYGTTFSDYLFDTIK